MGNMDYIRIVRRGQGTPDRSGWNFFLYSDGNVRGEMIDDSIENGLIQTLDSSVPVELYLNIVENLKKLPEGARPTDDFAFEVKEKGLKRYYSHLDSSFREIHCELSQVISKNSSELHAAIKLITSGRGK
jgi:hypothetical protein